MPTLLVKGVTPSLWSSRNDVPAGNVLPLTVMSNVSVAVPLL